MSAAATGPLAVAVVMPTRNQASFIEASIDSVMAQEVPGLRLLVQDGASTDGTPALLARLAERHAGLQWVSEPDGGPADALNRAFGRALADPAVQVIGWLNSDDLYTPGALSRALAHLHANPHDVAVYGEGEHIDLAGQAFERYPTRLPDTPLSAWADGCPICQPTMVLRREAVEALLPLDTGLRTAFDFELWLRLFKRFAGRIGCVRAVQAHSRLHAEGITLRMRETVAMEGLQVVARHLGSAPGHWLMTHVGEALAACPFDADADEVRKRLLGLAVQAEAWMAPGTVALLQRQMRQHRSWMVARPDFAADPYGDGWAPPALVMRVRQRSPKPYRTLRLWGRHAGPQARLALHIDEPFSWRGSVTAAGSFQLSVPLPPEPGAQWRLTLHCEPSFVPAEVSGGNDRRRLAYQFDAAELA